MSVRITVVIPNYNHGRFLEQRIRSVLAQTMQDFEVIYVDNRSTDDSLAIARQFESDPRFRIHVNERHSPTPFTQWNTGVSLARGEFVWIAESDDWAEPELLETLLPMLETHPSMGLAFCNSVMRFGDAEDPVVYTDFIADRYPGISRMLREDFVMRGTQFVTTALHRVNAVPNASAVVFRKRDYEAVGGAPRDMRLNGDWLTYARLCEGHEIGYSARALNHNRIHERTVRMTVGLTFRSVREVYRLLAETRRRFDIPREQVKLANREYFAEWSERVWLGNAGPAALAALGGLGVDRKLLLRLTAHLFKRLVRKFRNGGGE